MRVICIAPIDTAVKSKENEPRPSIGDVDTVLKEIQWFGIVYYELERFGEGNGYRSDCFAILSDPEEVIEEPELAHA